MQESLLEEIKRRFRRPTAAIKLGKTDVLLVGVHHDIHQVPKEELQLLQELAKKHKFVLLEGHAGFYPVPRHLLFKVMGWKRFCKQIENHPSLSETEKELIRKEVLRAGEHYGPWWQRTFEFFDKIGKEAEHTFVPEYGDVPGLPPIVNPILASAIKKIIEKYSPQTLVVFVGANHVEGLKAILEKGGTYMPHRVFKISWHEPEKRWRITEELR